jgi:hypothetical protein
MAESPRRFKKGLSLLLPQGAGQKYSHQIMQPHTLFSATPGFNRVSRGRSHDFEPF